MIECERVGADWDCEAESEGVCVCECVVCL